MSGLFATFNIGKRGLFAHQKAIDVTSHNIANANTEGYSRQRATLETTRPFAMPSIDNQVGPGQIGTGVDVSCIKRIRDGFMDYQVRKEKSTLGQYEARDKYLSEIESIFNEPTDDGLSNLIGKFFNSWDQLSKQPESSNARTVVAQQSAALADELNHTYNQLMSVKSNAQDSIKQTIFDVNGLLDRLDKLNQQIMSVKVSGMEPNDLMDERDLLLDQLSEKFNIRVEADNFYAVNVSPEDTSGLNSNANALLVRKNPNDAVRRFSYITGMVPTTAGTKPGEADIYEITYLKNGDKDKPETIYVKINSEEEYKNLEQSRVLWSLNDKNNDDKNGLAMDKYGQALKPSTTTKPIEFSDLALFNLPKDENKGELKGYMSVQKDVDNYIDQLNKLAKGLAFAVNAVHSGEKNSSNDTMPFFVNKDAAQYTDDVLDNLADTLTAESEITAGNISVNMEIIKDVMKIKTGTTGNPEVDGENDGKRALALAQLRDTLIKFQDINNSTNRSFVGNLEPDSTLGIPTIKSDINGMKIDNYFKDTIDKLGIQEQEAKRVVKNQEVLLRGFQERRDSISGVSIDEEMANLVQFQHAYQANAKVIATVDELLDVVVNGLKR